MNYSHMTALAAVRAMLEHRIRNTMAAEANALELAEQLEARASSQYRTLDQLVASQHLTEVQQLAKDCRIVLAEQTAILDALTELKL